VLAAKADLCLGSDLPGKDQLGVQKMKSVWIMGRQQDLFRIGNWERLTIQRHERLARPPPNYTPPGQTSRYRFAGFVALQEDPRLGQRPRTIEILSSPTELDARVIESNGHQLADCQPCAQIDLQPPGRLLEPAELLTVESHLDGGHPAVDGDLDDLGTADQPEKQRQEFDHRPLLARDP
jgi:hypothetical protein